MIKKYLFQFALFFCLLFCASSLQAQCADPTRTGDCDGDGILNGVDLDDDNDGILDIDEGFIDLSESCIPNAWLFSGDPTNIFEVDLNTGATTLVHTLAFAYNGVGYNERDGTFWGGVGSDIRIVDALTYATVDDLITSTTSKFITGDINSINDTYVASSSTATLVYDVDPSSPTYRTEIGTYDVRPANISDIAFDKITGLFYGLSSSTLYSLDPSTGMWTNLGVVSGLPNGSYGAAYATTSGEIYFGNNNTGVIYLMNTTDSDFPNTITITEFITGPIASTNDGARCTFTGLNGEPLHTDSDFDGIPDYLDTDSDNDGCLDAIEGDALFQAGNVDNQGQLLGNVDLNGVPLNASGGQGVGSSQDDSINGCGCIDDTDDDGICNSVDLDDDNDGILDSEEYFACGNPTFGTNIFDDFGTGTQRSPSPYISGDYSYSTAVNVVDGGYTIINGTKPEAAIFPQWKSFEDHTPGDTNGKMMVINAAYTPGEFYRRTLSGITTNTVVVLSFWVRDVCPACPIRPNITYSIEDLSGNILSTTNTGDIPDGWQEYSLTIDPGFNTSLQFVLVNNAPGGVGNDLVLDDISFSNLVCDTDNDNIPDYLDGDSDNDGCLDAVEGAGAFFEEDTDPDGALNGGVDSNGIPLVATSNGQAVTPGYIDATDTTACDPCLRLKNVPIISLSNPAILTCTAPTTQISASTSLANVSYQWTTLDGNIISLVNESTITVDSAGTYKVVATSDLGCKDSTSVQVFADQARPVISINPPDILTCDLQQIPLDASATTNAILYEWTTSDGIILSGANTSTPIIGDAGSYLLIATAANGCVANGGVIVEKNDIFPIVTIATPPSLDCNVQEVILDGTGSSAGATYQWTTVDGNILNGGNTLQARVNAPGAYQLEVTFPTGCRSLREIFVFLDDDRPIAEAGADVTLSCSNTSVQLDANFSQNGISYQWTTTDGNIVSGNTTTTPTVDQAGLYTLVVTAANGCTASDDLRVLEDLSIPTAVISVPEILTCVRTSTILDGVNSQNAASFAWSTIDGNIVGNANIINPSVNAPGTYTLVVTAANGCTATTSIQVNEDVTPPNPFISPAGLLTCDLQQMTLNASGTTGAVSYVWTTTDGIILSDATTPTPIIIDEGTYTLVTTAANGCTASESITINKDASIPNAVIAAPATLNCTIREITLDGAGSTTGATYQWTTTDGSILSGATTLQVRVNATGTYRLLVITGNGCSDFEEVFVPLDDSFPIAEAGTGTILTCTNTTYQLDAGLSQNAVSYAWTSTNGNIVSGANTVNPTVDQAGLYTVVVTGSNGCTASDEVSITQDVIGPTAAILAPEVLTCTITSTTLEADVSENTASFSWSTTNGNITSDSDIEVITVNAPGTYILDVVATNGCTASTSIQVNEDVTPPSPLISPAGLLTCDLQQMTLNASGTTGAVSYVWTTTDGIILSDATTPTPIVIDEGTYTLVATAANGCTASESITVSKDASIPDAVIATPATLNCTIREITLDGTGSTTGATYQWTTTDGSILSGATTLQVIVNATGTYRLIVTTGNGCSDFEEVFVPLDDSFPIAEAGTGTVLTCTNTTYQLDAGLSQNAVSYAWTSTNGNIVSGANTVGPTVDQAGLYTVVVTGSNGCTASDEVSITQDVIEPTAAILAPEVLTCTIMSTLLEASVSENTASFSWSTTNGNITSDSDIEVITINAPGIYTLDVIATNGCTASASIQVNEDITPPNPVIRPAGLLTCGLQQVTLDASVTTGAVSYVWTTTDGIILSDATTPTPIVIDEGTYTLVATAANGCTASESITVSKDASIPDAVIAAPATLDCTIREITLDGTGSTNGATYQWTTTDGSILSDATTLQVRVNATGTYRLVVTTQNGCSDFEEVFVPLDDSFPIAEAGTGTILTCTNTTYQLDAGLSQNVVSYAWTSTNGNIVSGANTVNPTVDQAGLYTVVVTGSNGCTASDEVSITQDVIEPTAAILAPEVLTCTITSTTLEADVSDNTASFSWSTTNGNITSDTNLEVITVNAPGTYILDVVAENGCTASTSIQVNEDITPPNPVISPAGLLTCDLRQLILDGSGTTGAISYIWTTTDGIILSGSTSSTPVIMDEGTYTLVATAANGCTASESITVNKDTSIPDAVIAAPATLDCTIREITLDGTGSTIGAGYQWTTINGNIVSGATTLQATVNATGTYRLIVTRENGCTDFEEVFVQLDDSSPIAEAGTGTILTCTNTSYQLDAGLSQNAVSYAWTSTNGNIVSGANTVNPTVDQAGLYTVVVTGSNGCTASDEVSITQDVIEPTAAILAPEVLTCTITSTTLEADVSDNTASFSWSTTNGNITSDTNLEVITVNAPGTYILDVVAENGCTASTSIQVNEDITPPNPVISPADLLTCDLQQVTLDASGTTGAVSYVWTTTDGIILSNGTTPAVVVGDEGTYTIVATAANGCTASESITVNKDASIPDAVIIAPTTLDCNIREITLDGAGSTTGANYQWTTTDGSILSGATTLQVRVNATGTYRLIVTTENGCSDFEEVFVPLDDSSPIAEAGTGTILTCTNTTYQLDAGLSQNAISYEWTTANGNIISGANTVTPTVDQVGVYTLVVTSVNGCTASDVVAITQDVIPPTISLLAPEILTCTVTSIQLDASASQNVATYQWTTTNGNIVGIDSTEVITIDAPGTYVLLVTGANGCTTSNSILVNEDVGTPTPVIASAPILTCDLQQIPLDASASTNVVSAVWTTTDGVILDDGNTLSPFIADEGTYTLVVTAANGCTASESITITKDLNVPNAIVAAPSSLDCNIREITLDATNSTPNATYLWTTVDGNIVSGITGLQPIVNAVGTYRLQVTNSNGCFDYEEVYVPLNEQMPFANAGTGTTLNCVNTSYQLDAGLSQNVTSYLWTSNEGNITSGAATATPTIDQPGIYSLVVTGSNGCTASDEVLILQDLIPPTVGMLAPDLLTCVTTSILLDASISENVSTYLWTTSDGNIVGEDNTTTITVNEPGTYNLLVTAPNGCTASMSMLVNEEVSQPPVSIEPAEILTCNRMQIRLNGNPVIPELTYVWTTDDGIILDGANTAGALIGDEGTYTLNVKDVNGCTNSTSITVQKDESVPDAMIAQPDTLTCNNLNLTLDATSTDPNNTIQWTTQDGSIIAGINTLMPTVNSAGTYRLVVTQANGCTDSEEIYVPQNNKVPLPEAGLRKTINCASPVAILDASLSQNVVDYQWSTADGSIISGGNTSTPMVDAPGTYLVITTGLNGCKDSDQVIVTSDFVSPVVGMLPPATLTCENTLITLDGSPSRNAISYSWTTTDGNIVGANSGVTIQVDAPGIYDLVVTSDNGCTDNMFMQVNQDDNLPPVQIATPQVLTCNLSNVRLDGSQVIGGLQYVWTTEDGFIVSDANTAAPLVSEPGTYTLTTTANNGCKNSASVTVIEDEFLPIVTVSTLDQLTCFRREVTINTSVSIPGGFYQWFTEDGNIVSGQDGLNPVVNEPGLYVLMVEMPNGCINFKEVIISQDAKVPFAEPGLSQVITCIDQTVTLDASLSQNVSTYLWETIEGNIIGTSNTVQIEVDKAGIYTLTTTGENGCSVSNDVEVFEDIVSPSIAMLPSGRVSCEDPIITLDASPSEGVVRYDWSTLDGNIVSGASTMRPSINASGTYTLTATADNGCIASMDIPILADTISPVSIIASELPINCSSQERQLNGAASQNAVTFNWGTSDGAILRNGDTPNPTIEGAGTYSLTVKSSNGCTHTSSIIITSDNNLPTVNIAPPETLTCNLQEITLDGTASTDAVTYNWKTQNGQIVGHTDRNIARVNLPGLYILEVTSANGCISRQSVMVEQDMKVPIADAGISLPITCAIRQRTLDGSNSIGAVAYEWSTTTTGAIISDITKPSIEITNGGLYTLEITNANGCTSTDTINVDLDITLPEAIITPPNDLSCKEPTIILDGGSSSKRAVQYEWTTVGGNFVDNTNRNQREIEADQAGIYILEVTAINGCTHSTEIVLGKDVSLPNIVIDPVETLNCTLTSQVIDASKSTNVNEYHWFTNDGKIVKGDYSATPTIDAPGTYNLLVAAKNGCISEKSISIAQDTMHPTLLVEPTHPLTCLDPSMELRASSPQNVSYSWNTLDGAFESTTTISTPRVTSSGLYTVVIEAANGCTSSASLEVIGLQNKTFESFTESICHGENVSFGNKQYSLTGFYIDTLFNANEHGCDSIITLDLEVRPLGMTHLDIFLCPDEVFTINGNTYNGIGSYSENFVGQAANGCDSIVHFNIEIDRFPVSINAPVDITISCEEALPSNEVILSDTDDLAEFIEREEVIDSTSCSYTIRRNWTTIDNCGNEDTKTQLIYVTDNTPPVIETLPDRNFQSCNYELETPSVSDNCDVDIEMILEEENLSTDPCNLHILRRWKAEDECGNFSIMEQEVSLVDEEGPKITFQHPKLVNANNRDTIIFSCNDPIEFNLALGWFKDNCDPQPKPSFRTKIIELGCFYLVYAEWQAVDACGNASKIGFYIRRMDQDAPILSNLPQDVSLGAEDAFPSRAVIEAVDNCDDFVAIEFDEIQDELACTTIMTRTWTATDNCGNSSVHTQLLERPNSNCIAAVSNCSSPKNIVIEPVSDFKVSIQWEAVEGAVGYEVRIRIKGETEWKYQSFTRKNSVTGSGDKNDYEIEIRSECGDGSYSGWSSRAHYTLGNFKENVPTDVSSKVSSSSVSLDPISIIHLYPNPTKSNLTVIYPFEKGMTLVVQDLMGKTVYLEKMEEELTLRQLDVTTYQSGIYFLSIQQKDGSWLKGTNFIKQE